MRTRDKRSRERITRMTTVTDVIAVEKEHVLQVYRRGSVVFDRGRGCRLFDTSCRSYLDLVSGVGVAALGRAQPEIAQGLADESGWLHSNHNVSLRTKLRCVLSPRLSPPPGLPRACFRHSGADAVEAALKFSRRYWFAQGKPRSGFVAFQRSFHGRTMGAVSVTWDDHYRGPFQPLVPDVTFVAADDISGLRAAVTDRTAAVIVEPIQGEGGVRPISSEMGAAIMDVCRSSGALLIADEIQCGLGRTGHAFCSPGLGLQPDLMTIGKSLGAGVPIAATLFTERVAAAAAFGDHGSTYGGNLLACRAALVFLNELMDGGLMAHVARAGEHLKAQLNRLQSRHSSIREVRGEGLMWGLELDRPAAPIVDAAIQQGLLVNRTADTVVRLLPPYIITSEEIDEAMGLLDGAFVAAFGGQQR